jgi:hypothetical protein
MDVYIYVYVYIHIYENMHIQIYRVNLESVNHRDEHILHINKRWMNLKSTDEDSPRLNGSLIPETKDNRKEGTLCSREFAEAKDDQKSKIVKTKTKSLPDFTLGPTQHKEHFFELERDDNDNEKYDEPILGDYINLDELTSGSFKSRMQNNYLINVQNPDDFEERDNGMTIFRGRSQSF